MKFFLKAFMTSIFMIISRQLNLKGIIIHISNMSTTSPWDWSTDPRPGQDQTSAAGWLRNVVPQ
ncbi:hypothetical protein HanRHA438_Chr01g0002131 [Helianthus annuus]|nr:hypothetical protein HanRHA438_Chr01g0002131 [Helianthus annuus]